MLALGLAGSLALSTSAFAQTAEANPAPTADDRANDVKARADGAMETGNFVEAHALYREAYTISPQPALLYNMGRAEERLGLYTEALRNLEQFSRAASPELKARVPKLAELLAEVRAHVALVTLRSNVAGARVMLRGRYVASTPVRWSLATTGGKATLEVSADGYLPYQKEVVLEEGKNTAFDVNLLPKEGPPPPMVTPAVAGAGPSATDSSKTNAVAPSHAEAAKDDGSQPVTSKWWFWTVIGVGVVGGVALTAVLLNTDKSAPRGDLAPGQASAPLLRF